MPCVNDEELSCSVCFFFFSSAGLISMSKPSSFHSSSSDSALPTICKDSIAATVSRLRASSSSDESESLADKLTLDLLSIYNAANSIAGLYGQLDDNSQENCEFSWFSKKYIIINWFPRSNTLVYQSEHMNTEDFGHAGYCAVIPNLFWYSRFVCVCVCSVFMQHWSADSSCESYLSYRESRVHYHPLGLQYQLQHSVGLPNCGGAQDWSKEYRRIFSAFYSGTWEDPVLTDTRLI